MIRRILAASASAVALSAAAWAGSVSTVNQDATTSGMSASVTQIGPEGSISNIQQLEFSSNSSATVSQIDNGANPTFPSNSSFIQQWGTSNSHASVAQDASAASAVEDDRQSATIYQTYQDSSYAGVTQNAFGGQDGSENAAYIDQYSGQRNQAYVTQAGYDSNGSIFQYYTADNYALINQFSDAGGGPGPDDDNNATIYQVYGQYDAAYTYQTGDRNRSYTQQGDGVTFNFANLAVTSQTGSENQSDLYQVGTSNEAWVTQDGLLNVSYVSQNGTDNYASVWQRDNGNTSSVVQGGSLNSASVTQGGLGVGGHSSSVTQLGNGGSATVVQQ